MPLVRCDVLARDEGHHLHRNFACAQQSPTPFSAKEAVERAEDWKAVVAGRRKFPLAAEIYLKLRTKQGIGNSGALVELQVEFSVLLSPSRVREEAAHLLLFVQNVLVDAEPLFALVLAEAAAVGLIALAGLYTQGDRQYQGVLKVAERHLWLVEAMKGEICSQHACTSLMSLEAKMEIRLTKSCNVFS